MSKNKPNLIFLSSDSIAIPCVDALVSKYNLLVVTKSDKSQKRSKQKKSNELAKYCEDHNIQTIRINKFNSNILNQIKNHQAEYAVCFSFGLIIPNNILNLFPRKLINIHPSALPIYRGPSPIQTALLNNDKATAISFMIMNEKMDEGDVLKQIPVDISYNDTYQTLASKIAQISADEIYNILHLYVNENLRPNQQSADKAIYCKIINKSDGLVDFNTNAQYIYNKYRAYYEWPKIYTVWNSKKLILFDIEIYPNDLDLKPGTVFKYDHSIFVQTKNNALKLNKVQLENKKNMPIQAFLNGHSRFIGSILG